MTHEFKINAYIHKLNQCTSLEQLNMQIYRAEKIGINIGIAIELNNERAKELNFKTGKFGMFKLG